MLFRKNLTRQSVYHSVFIFTIIYFLLMYFQKRVLLAIFQTQLSFSIPNAIALATSDNTFDEIISRATNGAILTGGFLVIEILIFIFLISYFLWKLWRVHYIEQLRRFDFLLVIGLLILLIGSFYYAYVVASTSLETYTTVSTAINRVTPKQLRLLSEKWQDFLFNYQFSLGYLPRDVSMVIEYVKTLIGNVKEIAQIPDVLNQYVNRLSELKFHYFILMSSGFITLLISQLVEYRLIIKAFKSVKVKRKVDILAEETAETTNQLTQILADQQVLLTKMVDLQTDMVQKIKESDN